MLHAAAAQTEREVGRDEQLADDGAVGMVFVAQGLQLRRDQVLDARQEGAVEGRRVAEDELEVFGVVNAGMA